MNNLISDKSIERMNIIAALYYAGYPRRAIAEVFQISTERIAQILSRHARWNHLRWPPLPLSGGTWTRRDIYKEIPDGAMEEAEITAQGYAKEWIL